MPALSRSRSVAAQTAVSNISFMSGGTTKEATKVEQPRRSLPREARESEIVLAALRVLDRDPFAGLDEIAEEAGVTRQLVSLYFPGGGTQPIVDRILEGTIPMLMESIKHMDGANRFLEIEDEDVFRKVMAAGMDAYFRMSLDRVPLWMISMSRDVGGANVSGQIEAMAVAVHKKIFSGNARWGKNKLVKQAFCAQCGAVESLAYRYRLGNMTREEALEVVVELWVAFRFQVMPALG